MTTTPTVAHAEGMRRALYYTASAAGRLQLEALDLEGSESDRRLVQSLYAHEALEAMGR
jgi:hypothetical protein